MSERRKLPGTISFWKCVGKWVAGIMGAGVIGVILLFLYYWQTPKASTIDIQPLSASIPLRLTQWEWIH